MHPSVDVRGVLPIVACVDEEWRDLWLGRCHGVFGRAGLCAFVMSDDGRFNFVFGMNRIVQL